VILVAAPAPSINTYNLDPGAYRIYREWLSAHAGTFLDHSRELVYDGAPLPPPNHRPVWLSRSKHSSYPFNPNGITMMPSWVVDTVYATIQILYETGVIDYLNYLIYLTEANNSFTCIGEAFGEQGGTLAGQRINVGEPDHPINRCGFIQDRGPHNDGLRVDLEREIWRLLTGTNGASYVSQSVPSSMTAGERYGVSVTMRNSGSSNWTSGSGYPRNHKLGSQNPQDNSTWGFTRVEMPPGTHSS
jgi:hypothetical protein